MAPVLKPKARKQRYRNLPLAFLLGKCNCFFWFDSQFITTIYLWVKKRRLNHPMWWLDVGELTEKVGCCFFQIQEHRLSHGVYALKKQKKSTHGTMMYAWLQPTALDIKDLFWLKLIGGPTSRLQPFEKQNLQSRIMKTQKLWCMLRKKKMIWI